jgi:transcriptional regulator with XRE-family HTH domain
MSLAVYSRVGSVLQEAGLGLEDLRDHIAVRYGLAVDNQALAALARNGRVQRPDIEILEAVALTLELRVDDLLDVHDVATAGVGTVSSDDDTSLDPERDARLRELTALRDWSDRPLTEVEMGELETLIAAMGRALNERGIHAVAQHLGIPVEVAREQIMAQAKDASDFWESLVADPERMAAEVDEAKAHRRARRAV